MAVTLIEACVVVTVVVIVGGVAIHVILTACKHIPKPGGTNTNETAEIVLHNFKGYSQGPIPDLPFFVQRSPGLDVWTNAYVIHSAWTLTNVTLIVVDMASNVVDVETLPAVEPMTLTNAIVETNAGPSGFWRLQ